MTEFWILDGEELRMLCFDCGARVALLNTVPGISWRSGVSSLG